MKNKLKLLLIILLLNSCSNDEPIQQEDFIGTWTVTRVTHDGSVEEGWTGTHLTFDQTTTNGGRYSMPDTKYDSIWAPSGTWKKSDKPSELILDDTLNVTFTIYENELYILKRLPWTGEVCDIGSENCIPAVTGYWDFRLEKAK